LKTLLQLVVVVFLRYQRDVLPEFKGSNKPFISDAEFLPFVRNTLTEVYEKCAPEKLKNIARLMQKHRGKEGELLEKVLKKYEKELEEAKCERKASQSSKSNQTCSYLSKCKTMLKQTSRRKRCFFFLLDSTIDSHLCKNVFSRQEKELAIF
jgi:hypothetical protein